MDLSPASPTVPLMRRAGLTVAAAIEAIGRLYYVRHDAPRFPGRASRDSEHHRSAGPRPGHQRAHRTAAWVRGRFAALDHNGGPGIGRQRDFPRQPERPHQARLHRFQREARTRAGGLHCLRARPGERLRPGGHQRPLEPRKHAQGQRAGNLPDSTVHGRSVDYTRAPGRHGNANDQAHPCTWMRNPLFLSTAIEAVIKAGEIQMSFIDSGFQVSHKGTIDLVTEADVAVETMFRKMVGERFPDHTILAEEFGEDAATRGAQHCWVFDPIDGTNNYAHGLPIFCSSLALEIDGRGEIGAIYDPTRKELFVAERGGGAFLNGQPIHVSKAPTLVESMLVTGFPYDIHQRIP